VVVRVAVSRVVLSRISDAVYRDAELLIFIDEIGIIKPICIRDTGLTDPIGRRDPSQVLAGHYCMEGKTRHSRVIPPTLATVWA
jgi:hypothetical protein